MITDLPLYDHLIRGLVLVAVAMAWIILLVRIVGLRPFSKMTNFDFVATVATGSLLAGAGQASDWGAYLQALAAIAGIFAVQFAIALTRQRWEGFERAIQNTPVLLMYQGEMIADAMRHTRVSEDDLRAKLREANVLDPASVQAVVLETTGDLSVLHGDRLDGRLLDGVQGSVPPIPVG